MDTINEHTVTKDTVRMESAIIMESKNNYSYLNTGETAILISNGDNALLDLQRIAEVERELKKKHKRQQKELERKLREEENHKLRQQKAIKALNYLLNTSQKYAKFFGDKLKNLQSPNRHIRKRGRKSKFQHEINHEYAEGEADEKTEELQNTPKKHETKATENNVPTNAITWNELAYFKGTLHPYQVQGLIWLKHLYENAINGILADEMGLGKTVQVIALICHLVEERIPGPFLIVAPLSTLPNWLAEFKRFAPKLPVILFHGTNEDRAVKSKAIRKKYDIDNYRSAPVVLTSYQVPLTEHYFLLQFKWQYLIIDEGQRLKNHNCQLVKKLKSLHTLNRLLLTGTPLQNNLTELWSLLNFLLPQLFDNVDTFASLFMTEDFEETTKIIEEEQSKNIISTIHGVLEPFMLRRLKSDVLQHLVPKKEVLVYCPLSQLQRDLYKWSLQRDMNELLGKTEEKENIETSQTRKRRRCTMKNYKNIDPESDPESEEDSLIFNDSSITKNDKKAFIYSVKLQNPLMLLRRIVNHPFLVHFPLKPGTHNELQIDEQLIKQSGKMLVLDAMLPKLKEGGHKVLLFCTLTMVLDFIEEYLLLRNYDYCRLDGTQKLVKREEAIQEFSTNPDQFVFLISTRTGGLGLNLTAADTVILFDRDWNPQVDVQAQDRCHRIGQSKPVMVYTLITKGTIEERILTRATAKRRLEKVVIKKGKFNGPNEMLKSLTELKELEELLKSVDHNLVMRSNGYVFSDEELEKLLDRSELYEEMEKREAENRS